VSVVIKFVEFAGTSFFPAPERGLYLRSYDANGNDGLGHVEWTDKLSEALTFEGPVQAFTFYSQQSTRFPTDFNGEPNRPLTACTVEVVNAEMERR